MTNEVFMSSDVLRVPLKNENLALKRLDFYTTSLVSLWRWRKKMIAVARQRFIFTHLPAFLPKCIFHIHSFVSFITYFTKIKIVTLKIVIHKGTSWWPELRMNTNVLSYVKSFDVCVSIECIAFSTPVFCISKIKDCIDLYTATEIGLSWIPWGIIHCVWYFLINTESL